MKPGYRSGLLRVTLPKSIWGFRLGRSSDGKWSNKGRDLGYHGVEKYPYPNGGWLFAWFGWLGFWAYRVNRNSKV